MAGAEVSVVLRDCATVYTCAGEDGVGAVSGASVFFAAGRCVFVGPFAQGPVVPPGASVVDARGMLVVPGLVDCHTHTAYAGSRSGEFERRLAGESYVSILEGGGGINATVRATRSASEAELCELVRRRVTAMRDLHGVCTVEIKSGYGLSPESEAKLLRAARAGCAGVVRVHTTFMGAHTFPAAFRAPAGAPSEAAAALRAAYVRQVLEEQLPLCAPLADSVDVFCDRGAFALPEARAVLEAGRRLGLKVRAHAEQIDHTGTAQLVAELGGLSADHLERLDAAGAAAMGAAGVVAVMLPGAQLFLKDIAPPVALLRAAGVRLAVASDLNPGSSPVHSLWDCATLACVLQGLTVDEALLGVTRNAAAALAMPDAGWLGPGSAADAVVLEPPPGEPPLIASVVQHMGHRSVCCVVQAGRVVSCRAPISVSASAAISSIS